MLKRIALAACLLAAPQFAALPSAVAMEPHNFPYDGVVILQSGHNFGTMYDRMVQSIQDHEMLVLARPSASRGAAGRGIEIPGNAVFETYRNDFAVRMLEASIPAGIEAPLRYYLTENEDGTTTLIYRAPSAVFAPYDSDALDEMAAELDDILGSIAAQAVGE